MTTVSETRRASNAAAAAVLRSYRRTIKVFQRYQSDDVFADAVRELINSYRGAEVFEYPDHDNKTILELLDHYQLTEDA